MNALAVIIAIIALHADREPTMEKVELEDPPAGYRWIACVRDLEAPQVRCYAGNPKTMELGYADFRLND